MRQHPSYEFKSSNLTTVRRQIISKPKRCRSPVSQRRASVDLTPDYECASARSADHAMTRQTNDRAFFRNQSSQPNLKTCLRRFLAQLSLDPTQHPPMAPITPRTKVELRLNLLE